MTAYRVTVQVRPDPPVPAGEDAVRRAIDLLADHHAQFKSGVEGWGHGPHPRVCQPARRE